MQKKKIPQNIVCITKGTRIVCYQEPAMNTLSLVKLILKGITISLREVIYMQIAAPCPDLFLPC